MGDMEPEVEDTTDDDPAGRFRGSLKELAKGFPVPVRLQELEKFCDDPSIAMLRAAAEGGIGTLVYTTGRVVRTKPGSGGIVSLVSVAVIVPVEEFRRLVVRQSQEQEP